MRVRAATGGATAATAVADGEEGKGGERMRVRRSHRPPGAYSSSDV